MKKRSTRTEKKPTVSLRKAPGAKLKNLPAGKNFPVVGIGASAGGVEASSEFLKYLPVDLGMAYVFIHHLAPDFASNLKKILQRKTALPVLKVEEDTMLEPDHIYVIPPNSFMRIEGGHLKLKSRSTLDLPYHPIDYFFMSLAESYQHNAIGIILSGTASDGTLGLQHIKEKGGITFAQDESAGHNEMSRHAQESGHVDFVLSPQAIAEELGSIIRHPYTTLPPA